MSERAPRPSPRNEAGGREMTSEEQKLEEQIVRNWWEDTLNGSKPCSLLSTQWEITEEDLAEARERGLEIARPTKPNRPGEEVPTHIVYVAQPGKFNDLLSAVDLQRFRDLGLDDRLDNVLAEIGDKSIAEAMVYLRQYPRTDEKFDLGPYNAQRPEIAALAGLGFGYPACDVESYIKFFFFGDEPDPDGQTDPRWGYSLCSEHSKAELERQRREGGNQ